MRQFLYLTNARMVCITTQGKRIAMRREFAVSGAGAAEFDRFLAGQEKLPTHVFTDLAEEDFRLDTVPHVGASDRDAIMARKLGQMFRNSPYRYAQLQGRESEGRKDDRVVYTAVTNPEVLRPWLDALERHEVPLEGIYSTAVFSAVMLDELDLHHAHTLLVTFTPGEAMRQTYFRNREIRFSRLTPVDLQPGQSLGAMVAEETTRTWQYLDSLRHFGPEDRLEVCIILHPGDRAAVQPELRDFAQIQYNVLDIEDVATKLGLRPAPLGSSAEEVMVHLFLIRRAPNHFASPELRRFASLRRARILLGQASAAILLASLGLGAWNLVRAFQSNQDDDRYGRQLATLHKEADDIASATPSFGVGGATMRDAVTFYNGSIKAFPAVGTFVREVSQVLQAHGEVTLTQIAWQASDNEKAMPVLTSAVRPQAPVKAVARTNEPAAPVQAEDPNPPFAGGRYEIALIEGTVRVAQNDFRAALAQAERLAADLAALPGTTADVVESPLDVRPTLGIQGRQSNLDPAQMDARFVVRVVRTRAGAA